jgi:hypothetical protein
LNGNLGIEPHVLEGLKGLRIESAFDLNKEIFPSLKNLMELQIAALKIFLFWKV